MLQALTDKVTDVRAMRALGFCVSVAHAEYMAEVFRRAGIPALAVSGDTATKARADALAQLRRREVNCLFAADLFNEGLDVPEVDAVVLPAPHAERDDLLAAARPRTSAGTWQGRAHCLGFIGQHRREFRFDVRYRPLTGSTRKGLERQIESGFPFLPSSQLMLDRVAQQIVLDNVRRQLRLNRKQLVADMRSYGDPSLARYLEDSGHDLADVYRGNGSWTGLRREASLPTPPSGPDDKALLRRVSSLAHVDDPERADLYSMLAAPDAPDYEELTERQQRLARMLFFTLWPNRGGFASYAEGLAHLQRHPAVCAELQELMAIGVDRSRHTPRSLGQGLQHVPLLSHAHYRREEILAALDWANLERSARGNITGVAWAEETQTDALLINLRKTEHEFSPTTMYRDYAISPELFHWESQNATTTTSEAGRRYIRQAGHRTHVVLFVRESPTDELGAAPFLCLGQAAYVEHRGERPIAITWRLDRPMPAETFRLASVVSVIGSRRCGPPNCGPRLNVQLPDRLGHPSHDAGTSAGRRWPSHHLRRKRHDRSHGGSTGPAALAEAGLGRARAVDAGRGECAGLVRRVRRSAPEAGPEGRRTVDHRHGSDRRCRRFRRTRADGAAKCPRAPGPGDNVGPCPWCRRLPDDRRVLEWHPADRGRGRRLGRLGGSRPGRAPFGTDQGLHDRADAQRVRNLVLQGMLVGPQQHRRVAVR